MTKDLFERTAQLTYLSVLDIQRIVKTAPRRYKVYSIPKRSGGLRTIAQPSRELKDIQRIVIREVLSRFPIHNCSKAYREGLGIIDNAKPHSGTNPILKMDFKNFFPSIKAHDFEVLCKANGLELSADDMRFCKQVLFWRPSDSQVLQLSIGAPSSPMLSNAIMYELDCLISKHCDDSGITYTRYADDLTFSSAEISSLLSMKEILPKIVGGIKSPALSINNEKSVVVTCARRRTVTGVVLANDGRLTLGRDRKRILRAKINHLAEGTLDDEERLELHGWLSFLKSIEPDAYERLTVRLGGRVKAMNRPED